LTDQPGGHDLKSCTRPSRDDRDERTDANRGRRGGHHRPPTAAYGVLLLTIGHVTDAIFEDRRLAELYDPLDPDRSDLDAYVELAERLGVRRVLDIGCGTGTFACLLACLPAGGSR
jgi:SAM-dependent methyltransferase